MATPSRTVIASLVERAAAKPSARIIFLDQLIEEQAVNLNDAESASEAAIAERLQDLSERAVGRVVKAGVENRKKLERATTEIQQLLGETYAEVGDEIVRISRDMARKAPRNVRRALREAGAEIATADFSALSAAQLREAVQKPIFGWGTHDWMDWHAIDHGATIDRELRASFFAGEGMEEASRKLFYILGPDGVSRNTLRVTARTAIQQASNSAAEATYQANSDVLSGMQVIATLDNRTCPQCGARDGEIIPFRSTRSRPPFHPQCRCNLAPAVKASFFPGLDPKVPTWSEWITGKFANKTPQQVADRQERALGPTVSKLLRSGRIGTDDLIKRDGSRRTVAEVVAVAQRTKTRKAA